MAHKVRRGKSNSWQFVVDLGYDASGERIRKMMTYKVENEKLLRGSPKNLDKHLESELMRFEHEVKSGNYIEPDKMAFPAFVDEWKRKFVNVHLEEKTKDNYIFQADKRIVPYFKNMRIDQIKTLHILGFLEFLQTPAAVLNKKEKLLGPATMVYNYRVLRSIFKWAVEWKVISKENNPMNGVKKPKENPTEMEYYDESEVEKLLKALEKETIKVRTIVMLAFTTSMRRGEMSGLEDTRIDLEAKELVISQTIPKFSNGEPVLKQYPKNKKPRKITLAEIMIETLRQYYDYRNTELLSSYVKWRDGKHSFLFCHPDGKPLHPHRFTKIWIEFHRRHNLKPIRFHDLRHTSVSWMIHKKVPTETIAKRIGHSNTKTTEIYSHIFKSADQVAASVFDNIHSVNK